MKQRPPTESAIQSNMVSALRVLGYTVIEIGRARGMVPCQWCKRPTRATGWQGNTVGAPDLMVTHRQWSGDWVAIEVKRPGGAVRQEQKDFVAIGATTICRSLSEALAVVRAADERHGNPTATLDAVIAQL